MKRHRLPLPGGEYVHQIELPVPQVRAGTTPVRIVAVGDGEQDGRLLPRTKFVPANPEPILPGDEELTPLPRRAKVAFAARCARRVLPVLSTTNNRLTFEHLRTIIEAIKVSETLAAGAAVTRVNVACSAVGPAASNDYASYCAARAAADTFDAARALNANHYSKSVNVVHCATAGAVAKAAESMLFVSSDPRDLLGFRRDFNRLRKLAQLHCWTDDTPVPPEVFGPLWPEGRTPKWAQVPENWMDKYLTDSNTEEPKRTAPGD